MRLLLLSILLQSSLNALTLARLQYDGGGDWYNDPDVLPNLAREINRRTELRVEENQAVVRPTDPAIFSYPFLYMTGHGRVRFSEDDVKSIRKYLENGGFLYADDDYGMDRSFREEIKKIFPGSPLVEVPFSNPIFRTFYDFPDGLPKIHEHYAGPPKGYAIFHEGRMVVFYTYNTNISDGWTPSHNDPEEVRELAFRMGINIVLYALTY